MEGNLMRRRRLRLSDRGFAEREPNGRIHDGSGYPLRPWQRREAEHVFAQADQADAAAPKRKRRTLPSRRRFFYA